MALDPGTEQLLHLSSEVLTAQDQLRRQQRIIFGLATCLRAERMASAALCDLLDELLSDRDA